MAAISPFKSWLKVGSRLGQYVVTALIGEGGMGQAEVQAPMFEVDPLWPKPLLNNWTLGNAIGIAVDSADHVWMIHRTTGVNDNFKTPGASCCTVAPPILEFNQAGDLTGSWGGPGEEFTWPDSNHGLWIDYKGNF